MQAAAFKDKKRGSPDNKEAQSKPPPDPAQVPRWLPRAMMNLYVLLAVSCVILLVLVLVKSECFPLSAPAVSLSVGECQEEGKKRWSDVDQSIKAAKQSIDMVKSKVHEGNQKLRTLATGALRDLHWVNLPPCPILGWVLGSRGRGQQGSCPSRAQGLAR
uniref:Mast cell-expressed membrane protein 1 n=1 Tax=Balaenoptera musculus TaxID=9771 RepID=A0A8C0HSI7_BALMU